MHARSLQKGHERKLTPFSLSKKKVDPCLVGRDRPRHTRPQHGAWLYLRQIRSLAHQLAFPSLRGFLGYYLAFSGRANWTRTNWSLEVKGWKWFYNIYFPSVFSLCLVVVFIPVLPGFFFFHQFSIFCSFSFLYFIFFLFSFSLHLSISKYLNFQKSSWKLHKMLTTYLKNYMIFAK